MSRLVNLYQNIFVYNKVCYRCDKWLESSDDDFSGQTTAVVVSSGLVEREETGSSSLYTLNRQHLAAPVIERLANLRGALLERLRQTFEDWEVKPVHVSMFGSTARGDGDTASDIDLFVVRRQGVDAEDEAWRAQLDELADAVRRWTGNPAGIVEIGEGDLTKCGAVIRRCSMSSTPTPLPSPVRAVAKILDGGRLMARQGRKQPCSVRDARVRRSHARKFLEVAEIAADEQGHDPEYASVASEARRLPASYVT